MQKKFYRLMQIKHHSHAMLETSCMSHTHRNLWNKKHWKKTDDKLLVLKGNKTKESPCNRNLTYLMKSLELWVEYFP